MAWGTAQAARCPRVTGLLGLAATGPGSTAMGVQLSAWVGEMWSCLYSRVFWHEGRALPFFVVADVRIEVLSNQKEAQGRCVVGTAEGARLPGSGE